MHANELAPLPEGTVGGGLPVPGGLWGLLGSDILASSAAGEHGSGLAANDGLTSTLRYQYVLESRSAPAVVLHPDSSHEGPVPYSGVVRLYEQGTGDLGGTLAARSFSVAVGISGALAASEAGSDACAATGQALVAGFIAAVEGGQDGSSATGQIVIQATLVAAESGVDSALILQVQPSVFTGPAGGVRARVGSPVIQVGPSYRLGAIKPWT